MLPFFLFSLAQRLQIQGLEGLQNSVNEVLGKSLFNDGPDMHRDQENLSHDLAVPRPTRDNDDEHFVNLTAQRREGNSSSNFQQAQNQGKQQHPLIYAQAICSLLLSSLNGLEESSFNAQVFSLANDVVCKSSRPCVLTTHSDRICLFCSTESFRILCRHAPDFIFSISRAQRLGHANLRLIFFVV